jgi:hypothetical protein
MSQLSTDASHEHLPRAQFVPNTARNRGHSRLAMVSTFLLRVRRPPSQNLTGFVFQAGPACSTLVVALDRPLSLRDLGL